MEANHEKNPDNSGDMDSQLSFLSQGFLDDLTRIEEQSRLEMESRSMIEDTNITKKSISEETTSNSEAVAALSDEQREVYMSALEGYNMFFTGDAGTGKSYVLRLIVSALKEKYGANNIYVTASTGIAACNISGTTLHSFAGIGVGDETVAKCVRRILQNKKAKQRWQTCEVLIIDEISMLDGRLFEKLEAIARRVRGSDLCFGGIQVIVCGDFFQLPPVGLGQNNVIYCFESECWNAVIQKTIIMKKVFRQKDAQLQALLRDIRYGHVSQSSIQMINRMSRNDLTHNTVMPTKLFAYNKSVDEYNESALNHIQFDSIEFKAVDEGESNYLIQLQKSCQAPAVLSLKPGAQVMLLKNLSISDGLVNGSRGVVDSYTKDPESGQMIPLVRFLTSTGDILQSVTHKEFTMELGSRVVARRIQLPLKLAWGISIHKSQGMTIDLLDVDLKGVFEAGMTYVALSRGVALDRMCLRNFSVRGVITNKKVIRFYQQASLPRTSIPPPMKQTRTTPVIDVKSEDEDEGSQSHEIHKQEVSSLPCSHTVKRPFTPPKRVKKEEDVDMDGWRALYEQPFHKELEAKPRNRFHNDMLAVAELEKDKEKPQLPLESVQNALIFKRITTRRQLLGSFI